MAILKVHILQRQKAKVMSLFLFYLFTFLPLDAQLLPRADDAFWRDSIPVEMRQSYIAYGEQFLDKPWEALPWTVFAENKQATV